MYVRTYLRITLMYIQTYVAEVLAQVDFCSGGNCVCVCLYRGVRLKSKLQHTGK
jgi:hypothetical protein